MKGKKKGSYRPAWRFPQIVEHEIAKWIVSPCLHVCSGLSLLGDIRLDLHERADVKADMGLLPFKRGHFASVIWDPPYEGANLWNTKGALAEMRDCLRVGGRLIVLHYLDAGVYLKRSMRLIYKAYYEPRDFHGLRVLVVLEKLPRLRIAPTRFEGLVPQPVEIWEPNHANWLLKPGTEQV